ncbi:MAG TPA: hypothetical protein VGH79_02610 [Gaiellaceae bacterium]|jgi:hypothetical protein
MRRAGLAVLALTFLTAGCGGASTRSAATVTPPPQRQVLRAFDATSTKVAHSLIPDGHTSCNVDYKGRHGCTSDGWVSNCGPRVAVSDCALGGNFVDTTEYIVPVGRDCYQTWTEDQSGPRADSFDYLSGEAIVGRDRGAVTAKRACAAASRVAHSSRQRCVEQWNSGTEVIFGPVTTDLHTTAAAAGYGLGGAADVEALQAGATCRVVLQRRHGGREAAVFEKRATETVWHATYVTLSPSAARALAAGNARFDGSGFLRLRVGTSPAGITPPTSREVVYMPAYGHSPADEKPGPSDFVIGNTSRRSFTWTGWGSPRAVGRGRVESNDCTPDCAAGHITWVPETAVLTRIVRCKGRLYYSRLREGDARPWMLSAADCMYY